MAETGVVDVPKVKKVLGRSGFRTQFVVPKEKGTTTTIIVMVNAVGMKVPPMVIHKGARVKEEWLANKRPETKVRASDSGWVNTKLFHEYGRVFLEFLQKLGLDRMNHVLLLDGHQSHTYNYQFLIEMYRSGVKVLCLPPHTSHFLQPLDNVPLAVFKSTWHEELCQYCRKYAGTALAKNHFFLLFNCAFRALTPPVIVRGFRETGMWPIDIGAIKEHKFAPSDLLGSQKHKLPPANAPAAQSNFHYKVTCLCSVPVPLLRVQF